MGKWKQMAYATINGSDTEISWVHRLWDDYEDGKQETEYDNKYYFRDIINGKAATIRYTLERDN